MVILIEVKALPLLVNKYVSRIDKSCGSRTLHLRWITLKIVRNLNKILGIHAEANEHTPIGDLLNLVNYQSGLR